jgi:protoheme IX farnesyltransferase
VKDATRMAAVRASATLAGAADARDGRVTPAGLASAHRSRARVADYVELTKPRLNLLVVAGSAVGFYLGSRGVTDLVGMAVASIGTALVAGGAAVLNQVLECDTDALMERTRSRPLPAGRLAAADARTFGVLLASTGLALLAIGSNVLAAVLALATLAIYLVVYTPLKRRSPIATLVGAIPGALPPLIGWTAGHQSASPGGWTLFAIVFLWQVPHFMAIAWMYRDDYGRAKFPMLPVLEPDGRSTGRQAAVYAAWLIPSSLLPVPAGIAGWMYSLAALVLGGALLVLAVRFAVARSDSSARALFFGSITYLPLIWAAMLLDHL